MWFRNRFWLWLIYLYPQLHTCALQLPGHFPGPPFGPDRCGLSAVRRPCRLRRRDTQRCGEVGIRTPIEPTVEFGDVEVLLPPSDGDRCDAVADVIREAASALHERIDAEQQGQAGHWYVRQR